MPIRCLMVDVDGVVVAHPEGLRWDRDLAVDLGVDPDRLQEAFFRAHFADIVLGRADLHERLAPVLAEIAPHVTSQAFADYWFAKDAHLDETLLADLAARRAEGLALHLATVQEHHRARHLWDTLKLSDRFDAIHYAAAYGSKKPDPAFFNAVAQRTGYAPGELLLIDDSPANVAGAKACGWGAALWDGSRSLDAVLADHGL